MMTQRMAVHWVRESFSPRKSSPDRAAKAGWRLWRTLKVFAGSFFIVQRSSVKGSALENIATPQPSSRSFQSSLKRSPLYNPKGSTSSVAKNIPQGTASLLFIVLLIFAAAMIYIAHRTPARATKMIPTRSPVPPMGSIYGRQGISLKAQECSLSQGATWFDYFASISQSYVNELLALCEAAKANGVVLDDADYASIDASIDSLTAAAESYGYSINQYLITAFGAGINTKDIKNCMEMTALAAKYSTDFTASLSYSDEQLEAYYDANKTSFEGVDVIAITIPANTYQETDADGNPVGDATSASKTAQEKANALAASASKDEFNAGIRDFLLNDRGNPEADVDAMVEQCYSEHVTASTLASAAEWAFSAKVGDTYVSGGDGASQYTVYYLAKTAYRDDTPGRNIRHILFTNTTYADDAKVNEVYSEWEAAGFTEAKFLELNKKAFALGKALA